MYTVRNYLTRGGVDLFNLWHERLRDRTAQLAIARRLSRLEFGNFGDHKPCGEGVWELRVDVGAGYRVYYALDGDRLILLIFGGDKGSQRRDIQAAIQYWKDWKERDNER